MNRIRKFYLHSKLNFGKYRGLTVEEVLSKDNGGEYLLFCKSSMKKIEFEEEALKHINMAYAEEQKIYANDEAMNSVEAGWDGHKNWK